jgi:predicted chitinase
VGAVAEEAVMVTAKQLYAVMPHCPELKLDAHLPFLNDAMDRYEIDTPKRQAAFIAQLAHESGELRYWEEIASGDAYEGRHDLGNYQPGDGRRFKGRGPIQITGRANYRAAGNAIGTDLEQHPERASHADVGFLIAGWYWQSRGLNKLADAGDLEGVTRKINGGLNGLAQRRAYYVRALEALGVTA